MKFENRIERDRRDYDKVEKVPSDLIWHGIQDNLRARRAKRIQLRLSVAASIILLVGAFTVFNLTSNETGEEQMTLSPEFNDEENKYYQMANHKMNELNYSHLDRSEYGEIIAELEELDSMYADLKSELSEIPNAEKAIQTAIKFHERRLHILELLEKEIENRKKEQLNEDNLKI